MGNLNNPLENGLIKNNYNTPNTMFNTFSTNNANIMSLGSYDEFKNTFNNNPEVFKKLGINNPNDVVNINGHAYFIQNKGFLDKYGNGIMTGINTAVGLGQLGLGLANFGLMRKYYKAQTGLAEEQLRETKAEYDRISKLRKAIAAKYSK